MDLVIIHRSNLIFLNKYSIMLDEIDTGYMHHLTKHQKRNKMTYVTGSK